jgi:putative nucleotidyltransferase with HDIG domain
VGGVVVLEGAAESGGGGAVSGAAVSTVSEPDDEALVSMRPRPERSDGKPGIGGRMDQFGRRPLREIRWERWRARPAAAWSVRVLIVLGPLAVGLLAGLVWRHLVRLGESGLAEILWLAGLVAVSFAAFFAAERGLRRLAPLPFLLRVSLAFPDRTPSRFAVALRAASLQQLRRRIDEDSFLGGDDATVAGRVLSLTAALNVHDRVTLGHSDRVRAYSEVIGDQLGLGEDDVDRLRWAALLHDIGKLAIPDSILNKSGALTAEEYAEVKTHAAVGAQLVEPLRPWLGPWTDAVGQHHEWWDGSGYPAGLAGDDIALGGRIVAVADAFDIMTSIRSYRTPVSADDARAELARCAGSQFDPAVVRAFVAAGVGRPARWALPALLAGLVAPARKAVRRPGEPVGGLVSLAAATLVAGIVIGPLSPAPTPSAAAAAPDGSPTLSAAPTSPPPPTSARGTATEPATTAAPTTDAAAASLSTTSATAGTGVAAPEVAEDPAPPRSALPATTSPPGGTVPAARSTTPPPPSTAPPGPSATVRPSPPRSNSTTAAPPRSTSTTAGPRSTSTTAAPPRTTSTAPPRTTSTTAAPRTTSTTAAPPRTTSTTAAPPRTTARTTTTTAAPPPLLAADVTVVVAVNGVATGRVGTAAATRVTAVAQPSLGTLALALNGAFVYTPRPGVSGTDRFVFEACDATGRCDRAQAQITIEPGSVLPGL